MTPLERAQELVTKLEAAGVRAFVDPGLIAPPCVLFTPPNITFGLPCGFDAIWRCPILAPVMQVAEQGTWEELDRMLTVMSGTVDLQSADLVAYTVNGRQYPAYLLTWNEGI
jgi:hypothetical protein